MNAMTAPIAPIAATAHATAAFEEVWRKYEDFIRRRATKLARGDDELCDELLQVGLRALWEIDASRVARADDMILLIRIRDRMKHHRLARHRAERRNPEWAVSERTLARLEAEAVEPASMRRARGEVWDPQDPCTEHL